jgi:hypothetical protein
MATLDPNLWVALQVSTMVALWRGSVLTPSTKAVYKGNMTYKIQHKFDNDHSNPPLRCGAYVRAVGSDRGTGIIVAVNDAHCLDEKTNKVYTQRIYQVHWLDMKNAQDIANAVYAFHPEKDLALSSRSVPEFKSVEEVEAWIEKQMNPGHWTDGVQDAVDSASDFDIALQQMLNQEQDE